MNRGSPDQRLAVQIGIGLRRGLSEEQARARAYEVEGLSPPVPPPTPPDLEDLHWRLACAERRAAGASERARILLRENRGLRQLLGQK